MLSLESIEARRLASVWTRVHPVFAIGQLGAFVVSLVLVTLYFFHLASFDSVYLSVLIKIGFMLGAIVTGALWEHDVFGPWWFAPEFYAEDVMTVIVFLLHIGFLVTCFASTSTPIVFGALALAYGVYGMNVAQYVVQHGNRKKRSAAGSVKAA